MSSSRSDSEVSAADRTKNRHLEGKVYPVFHASTLSSLLDTSHLRHMFWPCLKCTTGRSCRHVKLIYLKYFDSHGKNVSCLERREWQISLPQKPKRPFKMALECKMFWLETARVRKHVHHCQFHGRDTSYWISTFMKCKNNWCPRTSNCSLTVEYFIFNILSTTAFSYWAAKTSAVQYQMHFAIYLFQIFTRCIPCKCLT